MARSVVSRQVCGGITDAVLHERMKRARQAVDDALDGYLPRASDEPKSIHRAMRYSVFSGGKRIRPVIAIETYHACVRASRAKRAPRAPRAHHAALAVAAAVECVHAYSLIHDDLPSMDNDDYRRGKPTCHKVFGEAVAILAGDALLTAAFGILAKNLEPVLAAAAIAELADAIGTRGMVGGQVMDITRQGKAVTRAVLDRVNHLKTGRLFEAAAALGAIAARADRKTIKAMKAYGAAIGMAFQIVDDCLDGDGYASLIGKDRARLAGQRYTRQAWRSLGMCGKRARMLEALAGHLADRIR